MLRTILVLTFVGIGVIYTLQGPFYALLLYIGNAYFRPEQWVRTDLIGKLNLSYVSSVLLLLTTLITRQRFILNGRIVLLLLILLHTFISTVFSNYPAYSWPYWIEFLKAIVITYLIIILITDTTRLRLLLLVMGLALGLEQAKQGWYYLIFPPGVNNTNALPFLGDNNGVAVGMLMLVPIMAYLARTTQHTWARRGYWFLLIGCLFRALTTYSRGGFLACGALGVVYLLRTQQKLRALVGIIAVMMIVLPALPEAFWARMHTIQTYEEDTSATGRLHYWQVAIKMANANPLGIGHNAYNAAYDKYDLSYGKYGRGRSVHSSFFGILAEAGYIGFALFAAILVGAFWSCYRVQKHAVMGSIPVELAHGAAALEASLAAFVVGGSFVPFQYNELLWHFIGITIVLQQLADQHRIAHGKRSRGRRRGGVVAHAETTDCPDPMHPPPYLPPDIREHTPVEVQEYIYALEASLAALEATLQQLLERLQRNSHTASQRPSSNLSQARRQKARPKSRGRRPSGQPRPLGQSRMLLPAEEVNVLIPVKPMLCSAYGKRSRGRRMGGVATYSATTYYSDSIHTTPTFPPDVWERTPVEAQEYIRVLEARIAELEVTVQQMSLKA